MEEKIVICPYCGASVPKNWRFCPKCAHILTGEPTITVLTSPPDDKAPDWTDNLLEAVEVSYLDESDFEPLADQSDGPAADDAFTSPNEERPIIESVPPPSDEPGQPTSPETAEATPAFEKELIPTEPPLDDEPPLAPETANAAVSHRKKWIAAPEQFSLERFQSRQATDKSAETASKTQNAFLKKRGASQKKQSHAAAILKKMFLQNPGASSPSHSVQGKTASPVVISQLPDAAKAGSKRVNHRTRIVPSPIYLAVERKRNRRTAFFTLLIVLLLGCGAPFVLWRADTKALETSLELGWSRGETHERTPYTLALRFEDGLVEIYQKSPFYRNEYVLSQQPYTVTSPDTVEIDGKEYRISFSEDHTAITMRPALSFYGEKEVWYRQDSPK